MALRSPVPWLGSKGRISEKILQAFPDTGRYKVFCELFAGSASVLFAKPKGNHLEAINDANKELINFWMMLREEAEHLVWKLKSLPYAEALYEDFRESLESGEFMDELERAVRWFYVKRGTIMGHQDPRKPWAYASARGKVEHGIGAEAVAYQGAVRLLPLICARLQNVQTHAWDFERALKAYDHPLTLFYADPPYMGTEGYYRHDTVGSFTDADHRRLAAALNATQAMVVLSYGDHPLLQELYPEGKWRRIFLSVARQTGHYNKKIAKAEEVILCNFEKNVDTLF